MAVAVSFLDCINRGDIAGLSNLMTADHQLKVFDEPPLVGQEANTAAWRGYCDSFPEYVIYPHRIAQEGNRVAILGHTTGSHLGLPDEEERNLTLIWLVDVIDGAVRSWHLVENTPQRRQQLGLDLI